MLDPRSPVRPSTVLLFSGGRDSTLAACRLAERGEPVLLLTVTAPFLRGIQAVKRRVDELSTKLPGGSLWCTVSDSQYPVPPMISAQRNCLPCHTAYTLAGVATARTFDVRKLSYGYVGYQSSWPEQSPFAITALRRVLAGTAISLDLPVLQIASKEQAVAQLISLGLNPAALEQKCSRQLDNVAIPQHRLESIVNEWAEATKRAIEADLPAPVFASTVQLGRHD